MQLVKMSSASTTIKLFDNENINNNETKPTLNYFERNIQPIFDDIKTTEDLILWSVIVITICVGLLLNLLVMRSILRIKCNGLYSTHSQIVFSSHFRKLKCHGQFSSFFVHSFVNCWFHHIHIFMILHQMGSHSLHVSKATRMFTFQNENPVFQFQFQWNS